MKHKLNFKLLSPIAYSAYDYVVIGGGLLPDGSKNKNFFIQQDGEWKEIEGPECFLEDYPCVFLNRFCIFLAQKNLVVAIDSNLKVSVFSRKSSELKKAKTENPKGLKLKISKYRRNSKHLNAALSNYVRSSTNVEFQDYYKTSFPQGSESPENLGIHSVHSTLLSPSNAGTNTIDGNLRLTKESASLTTSRNTAVPANLLSEQKL